MSKENEEKKDLQPIQAFSFMVEVICKPKCEKQYIVRVQGPQGPAVMCSGTLKEFNQFIAGL